MSFKGILIQAHTKNPQGLRTRAVEGVFPRLPMVGQNFIMFAEPLDDEMDVRTVTTTEIRNVTRLNMDVIEFSTANSTYELTVTGSFDDSGDPKDAA